MAEAPLLRAENLRLSLPDFGRKPAFGPPPRVDVLNGIDLTLDPGEALGIVGESGSGKTSLGRSLVRLYEPTGGRIDFEDQDITHLGEHALRPLRARIQMIFQDPQSSLNPRQKVADIIAQPLRAFGQVESRAAGWAQAWQLLEQVGLGPQFAGRYAHELSGGQRQRVGIARAIALKPALVVADEIVSGLDVSSQAQILALLRELRADLGLALIFISHDLSVVRTVCDRVMVMLNGAVVESGACADIFAAPRHPYTRKLLDAIPLPDPDPEWIQSASVEDAGEAENEWGGQGMDIKGSIVLVTGANRGVGEAYVNALLDRGAAKVYAGVRDPKSMAARDNVEIIKLDITNEADVRAAVKQCSDVTLLINNAGVNFNTPLIGQASLENAQVEININYFGTLGMCRAFAPVVQANGGGAIVNMLSIIGLVNLPALGSYCASKAACVSLTQGVRAELAGQGTLVVGIMPGAIDTRITAGQDIPKEKPADVAAAALDAVETGTEDVYPGDMAQGVMQGLASDPKAVEKEFAGFLPS